MAVSEAQALALLNFEAPLDLPTLDAVVGFMHQGSAAEGKMASNILTQFKNHEKAWTRVHQILEQSQQQNTKFFALQVLEDLVKTQWKVLPPAQTEGIKNFVVQTVIRLSSDYPTLEKERLVLSKLNMVLVQILKRDWPKKWPTFIADIVGASETSESLCQNNMNILKLLSEEVFDFSKGQLTQVQANHLKDTMTQQFQQLFELCRFVLRFSSKESLVIATLQTLLRFLTWIPLGYIFETDLLPVLTTTFLPIPAFRNATLQCLSEIGALQAANVGVQMVELLKSVLEMLAVMIPIGTNLQLAYASAKDSDQALILNLAIFFSGYLRTHTILLEASVESHPLLVAAVDYMLMISEVDEIEIFKICLEYWNFVCSSLYDESVQLSGGLGLIKTPRRMLYQAQLSRLRYIMVCKMAKPEEVLVVENEAGEAVREFLKDTDSIEQYYTMREILVYLTHLDPQDTEQIMTNRLAVSADPGGSWKALNTLCWAIGSISGTMMLEDEKRFLVTVIKDLLSLCEIQRGKSNKACIASNIMYIVGQYPRFLKEHWKFLKTVVNKLFEFMHERHEGVQDMACDTFIKIAQHCDRHFVITQAGELRPYVEEIIENMPLTVNDLEKHQIHTFYEAVGHMIKVQSDDKAQMELIRRLMHSVNQQWQSIIARASADVTIFSSEEVIHLLVHILKCNVRACAAIGNAFVSQLTTIYMDMLLVYKTLSQNIGYAIVAQGETISSQPLIRGMRNVKKEILKLISSFVSSSYNPDQVLGTFVPPLLEAVLGDYQNGIPQARDAEVLSTMTAVVNSLKAYIIPHVITIFSALFEATLTMINTEFELFPDHRRNFYQLLQAITAHCFQAYEGLSEGQLKMVVDAIIWGCRHPMRDVADTALKILKNFVDRLPVSPSVFAQPFLAKFFLDILRHLFSIVTDTTHYSGLDLQSAILCQMFFIVDGGVITVPLSPTAPSNQIAVRDFVGGLLQAAFLHLKPGQLEVITSGFFTYTQDPAGFKEHLRDFIVQCKEVAGEDMTDLYLVERQKQLQDAQQTKLSRLEAIPGMLGN